MARITINQKVQGEIARIAERHGIDSEVLAAFAEFVIQNHKKKDSVSSTSNGRDTKTLKELKKAVYKHFSVTSTPQLKRSGSFKMATDGMDDLNLSLKATWEQLYRKFVGILPGEENQQGYGCINGVNIFDYFKPWQAFGLDPKVASSEEIKKAYHKLSKQYHPDVPGTGDPKVFDQINTMYQSISAGA